MSKNRRKYTRMRARGVAAHLRTPHGRAACQVENVSMGGLFVRTDHLEQVGSEILVDLVKPGWKRQLTLTARITSRVDAIDGRLSHRMPGLGMQFVGVDDKQHDRLEHLLRELGATDDDFQVTLGEAEEPELRALDLSVSGADGALDPQPQPVWQQVQMVKAETSRGLIDEIEGALREANLPPPEPIQAHEIAAPPPPPPPVKPASGTDLSAEVARLQLQLRGMVMQLSDAQQQLSQRDQEIARLREDLETAKGALARVSRKA